MGTRREAAGGRSNSGKVNCDGEERGVLDFGEPKAVLVVMS